MVRSVKFSELNNKPYLNEWVAVKNTLILIIKSRAELKFPNDIIGKVTLQTDRKIFRRRHSQRRKVDI